ncbi:MAG TPA: hypothetical protein VGO58_07635 [Chitinophagaceae bacterium]|jgi:hypothetical protein|nr:hypothetical protein [Chitinophagaceae bacterium]
MEVHHHSHTARKKFNHFFWEFFMLFLAVTLGFLVENWREHRIEGRREKALMKALLLDLRADAQQIDSLIQKRVTRNIHCDSLINLLVAGDKKNGILEYYYGRNASRRIHFRPQDGTLLQLRHSGGFGIVHEEIVLNGINSYELGLKNNQENIEVEEKELTEYTAVAAKIFAVKTFQEMTKNNTVEPPATNQPLLSYDKSLLNELAIKLHYWKRTSLSVLASWESIRKNATVLMELIKEEYNLEPKSH